MKHPGLCLFIMLLASVCGSASADWKPLGARSAAGFVELDTDRCSTVINNKIAYARITDNRQSLEIKVEIDCTRNRHKVLYECVSDVTGRIIRKKSCNKDWEKFRPASPLAAVRDAVCKQ